MPSLMYSQEMLSRRQLDAIASPDVQRAISIVREEGRSPKTLAALKTALVRAGLDSRGAERLARQVVATKRWGDGRGHVTEARDEAGGDEA